jgi:hypothetical protein
VNQMLVAVRVCPSAIRPSLRGNLFVPRSWRVIWQSMPRNGFRDTRVRKKCARGARLLAIFRSRSRAFFRAPHGSALTVPLSTRSRSRPQCRGGLYVAALQAPPPITVHFRFQVQPARAFGSPMGFSKLPCGTLGRLEGLAGRKWRLGNASAILLDFAPPPAGPVSLGSS